MERYLGQDSEVAKIPLLFFLVLINQYDTPLEDKAFRTIKLEVTVKSRCAD